METGCCDGTKKKERHPTLYMNSLYASGVNDENYSMKVCRMEENGTNFTLLRFQSKQNPFMKRMSK